MPGYMEEVQDDVLSWLEDIRYKSEGFGRWPYHAKMIRPWGLQSSGIAIRVLDEFDRLSGLTDTQKQEATAYFQSCQSPDDGLFRDPLETEDDYTGHHSWEQVWGQRNGAALEALDRLDAKPLYPPVKAQFGDLSKIDTARWTLEDIDWSSPWNHGESWSRSLKSYLNHRTDDGDPREDPKLVAAFEAVEQHIFDPKTGTPSRRMPRFDPGVAMAGLFKVMAGYQVVGRDVPFAEAAINFVLTLQHDDGDWANGDNMCMVWDSLWVLRVLDHQLHGGHRHDTITAAGRKTADFLMKVHRKPDGAFSFHRDHCQTVHHSIRLSHEPYPIGDLLGTTMSLNCLAYTDEWDGNRSPPKEAPLI